MRMAVAGLGIVWAVCCIGCGSGIEANAYLPSTRFVRGLEAKAEKLAASEFLRLSKAELIYKNTQRFDKHEQHPFNPTGGVYYKGYRELTRYTVEDVRHTDSYVRPVEYVVAYDYRLMTTPLRHSDLPESRGLSIKDSNYSPHQTGRYVLTYKANPDGDVTDPLPGVPPFENILLGKATASQPLSESGATVNQTSTDLKAHLVVPKKKAR